MTLSSTEELGVGIAKLHLGEKRVYGIVCVAWRKWGRSFYMFDITCIALRDVEVKVQATLLEVVVACLWLSEQPGACAIPMKERDS